MCEKGHSATSTGRTPASTRASATFINICMKTSKGTGVGVSRLDDREETVSATRASAPGGWELPLAGEVHPRAVLVLWREAGIKAR